MDYTDGKGGSNELKKKLRHWSFKVVTVKYLDV